MTTSSTYAAMSFLPLTKMITMTGGRHHLFLLLILDI
jgi:hypothetical protein